MNQLNIATAQFEHTSGDKGSNLKEIDKLSKKAAQDGAEIIAFHECSISGYTFTREFSKEQMLELAEPVSDGQSIKALTDIARNNGLVVLAGLFEKDEDERLYNTYVCVDKNGVVASTRKLHPFINSYLTPGNSYCVFELFGWKCGILICYDNNIIENVRAVNLLGADIIFMPHVTMCTPSSRPGAGFVDPQLWRNRERDPTSLRLEFDGMKGRQWLMKWLPARAFDNAAYVVFSNPIGMDADQLKNGCSMVIDPFGDIIAECRKLCNDTETAAIISEKIVNAGGHRYKKARRPELYRDIIGRPNNSVQKIAWLDTES